MPNPSGWDYLYQEMGQFGESIQDISDTIYEADAKKKEHNADLVLAQGINDFMDSLATNPDHGEVSRDASGKTIFTGGYKDAWEEYKQNLRTQALSNTANNRLAESRVSQTIDKMFVQYDAEVSKKQLAAWAQDYTNSAFSRITVVDNDAKANTQEKLDNAAKEMKALSDLNLIDSQTSGKFLDAHAQEILRKHELGTAIEQLKKGVAIGDVIAGLPTKRAVFNSGGRSHSLGDNLLAGVQQDVEIVYKAVQDKADAAMQKTVYDFKIAHPKGDFTTEEWTKAMAALQGMAVDGIPASPDLKYGWQARLGEWQAAAKTGEPTEEAKKAKAALETLSRLVDASNYSRNAGKTATSLVFVDAKGKSHTINASADSINAFYNSEAFVSIMDAGGTWDKAGEIFRRLDAKGLADWDIYLRDNAERLGKKPGGLDFVSYLRSLKDKEGYRDWTLDKITALATKYEGDKYNWQMGMSLKFMNGDFGDDVDQFAKRQGSGYFKGLVSDDGVTIPAWKPGMDAATARLQKMIQDETGATLDRSGWNDGTLLFGGKDGNSYRVGLWQVGSDAQGRDSIVVRQLPKTAAGYSFEALVPDGKGGKTWVKAKQDPGDESWTFANPADKVKTQPAAKTPPAPAGGTLAGGANTIDQNSRAIESLLSSIESATSGPARKAIVDNFTSQPYYQGFVDQAKALGWNTSTWEKKK